MKKIFEFTDRIIDKLFKNEKINSLLKKIINLEMFYYILFGVLTTVVSIVSFALMEKLLGADMVLINNVISWICAVLFAFVTNKFIVFGSKSMEAKTVIRELIAFAGARLVTLGIEEAGLFIAKLLHADEKIYHLLSFEITGTLVAKLLLQIIVIVLNYIFSKLFIFKDKKAD